MSSRAFSQTVIARLRSSRSNRSVILKTALALLLGSLFACLFACSTSSDPEDPPETSTVCFIGDSIMYYWDLEKYFPGLVISKHAVAGAVVEDIDDWDVRDCKGARTVFLMGTNNIWGYTSDLPDMEEAREYYGNLFVRYASKLGGKPLLFVSILPRNDRYAQDTLVTDNVRLQNIVVKRKLDSLGTGYRYIDVFDDFIQKGNAIDSTLFKDGLHPNEKGYEVLAAKLKPYLY